MHAGGGRKLKCNLEWPNGVVHVMPHHKHEHHGNTGTTTSPQIATFFAIAVKNVLL